MTKMALLIGVSEYEPGLNPLPSAVRDVKAIERVLRHPDLCGFAESDIRVLENPDRQTMEEAIETLFANRQKDDLVLLFFSGHGVKDEQGRLYLTSCKTRKSPQGELVRSTAVAASFIQESMGRSRSKRQVVLLDCCFSGAFAEGLSAKDNGAVDIKAQLGGEGRAILTSSTSTQYSFEQHGSDLSIYTRYLVEGIETGAADQDNSGTISVLELHEYARRKVQETAPAMQPEIYAVKEGFKILLAKASTADPKLKYRKEVEQFASRGEISEVARKGLEARRVKLGLLLEEAAAIEAEVVKPYREYKQRLQQYEREFHQLVEKQYPLSAETRNELKYFQQALGLRDDDVVPIETHLVRQYEAAQIPVATAPHVSASVSTPSLTAQFIAPFAVKSHKTRFPHVDSFAFVESFQRSLKDRLLPPTFVLPKKQQQWAIVAVSVLATCAAAYALGRTYMQVQANRAFLEHAKAQQSNHNYQDCMTLAGSVRSTFLVGTEADVVWHECKQAQAIEAQKADEALKQAKELLQQGQELAAKDKPGDAIALLQTLPFDSPLHSEVQQAVNQWSEQLRQTVQAYLAQGAINDASAAANRIPLENPAYRKAQEQIQQWRAEDDRNRQHYQVGQQALDHGDWSAALQEAGQMTNAPAWSRAKEELTAAAQKVQAQAIAQQQEAARQQEAERTWQTAQQELAQSEPDNAIATAQQLPDSPPWQERKQKIITAADALKRRQAACQLFSLGLGRCAQ
ncbi:MAG: caspase domain-containing protein [Leptolyngbya sp. BL-A-14]